MITLTTPMSFTKVEISNARGYDDLSTFFSATATLRTDDDDPYVTTLLITVRNGLCAGVVVGTGTFMSHGVQLPTGLTDLRAVMAAAPTTPAKRIALDTFMVSNGLVVG